MASLLSQSILIVCVFVTQTLSGCLSAPGQQALDASKAGGAVAGHFNALFLHTLTIRPDDEFAKASGVIDQECRVSAQGQVAMKYYENLAEKDPQEPMAVFSWAYATWIVSNSVDDRRQRDELLGGPYHAMMQVEAPSSYAYNRMLYILRDRLEESRSDLINVGRHLLKLNPEDLDVLSGLGFELLGSEVDPDYKEAERYGMRLERLARKDWRGIGLLGGVYQERWMFKHHDADRVRALAAYRKVLQMQPISKTDHLAILGLMKALGSK